MDLEKLAKSNAIYKDIAKCNLNIQRANYTQAEDVLIRETYLTVNGIKDVVEVPKSLFRTIGKLILSEYEKQLIELQKEFDEL